MPQLNTISISFLIFLAAFLGVGIFSATRKKNTSDDYLVASRGVHPWLVALSAVATNNSGFMFIGLIGMTFLEGLPSMWIMFGWVVGDYIAWFLRIPDKLRVESESSGSITIASFIGTDTAAEQEKNNNRFATIIAGIITLAFLGIYSAAQLNAGSKALHSMFGWEYEIGAILGAAIVVVYSYAGGIRASIWTDAVQSGVMFISMVLLMVVGLQTIGGFAGMKENLPSEMLSLWPVDPKLGVALFIGGWIFAGFGVVGQPHIMVRAMSIDSVENMGTARRVYFAWNLLFAASAITVGLIARVYLTTEQNIPIEGFDAELALPVMALALLPEVIVGMCLAGLFAATMSTADSQILSCSAVLTEDLFPTQEKNYTRMKVATITVAMLSLGIALYAIALERSGQESGVFQLVVLAWAALAAGLGPPLIVRCFGKRLPEMIAVAMMLAGIGGVLVWRYALELNGAVYDVMPGMIMGFSVYALWSLTQVKSAPT